MDTDFAPTGEARLRKILDAVVAEGDTAEYLGLEAKSDIDPSKKGVGVAKIAKFILGMANRLPEVAATQFKGYGVMVIGAEKGQALGIPKGVESHELGDRLRSYLGPDGPTWDLARLAVSDEREVLFVLVEPPRHGQSMFPCHKDFQPADRANSKDAGLADGSIYVRDKSQTRQAKAVEIKALLARSEQAEPQVTVSVVVKGRALAVQQEEAGLRRIFAAMAERAQQAEDERRAAKDEEERSRGCTVLSTDAAAAGIASTPSFKNLLKRMNDPAVSAHFGQRNEPSDPVAAQRTRERGGWARWPECRENLYAITGDRIQFTVENEAATYLASPELIVKIRGARGLDPLDADDVKVHEVLPFASVPRRGPYDALMPSLHGIRPITRPRDFDWSNEPDACVRVTLCPSAFRPSTPWTSEPDELVLIATDPAATELEAEWTLTAEGFGRRFDGSFTIPVRRVEDPVDLMREYDKLIREG